MQSKRRFRAVSEKAPQYPTHGEFEPTRRSFLGRLGLGLLAAATAGTLLVGCGERSIDEVHLLGGVVDGGRAPIDAGLPDTGPDTLKLSGGRPDMMGARIDGEAEVQTDADSKRSDR